MPSGRADTGGHAMSYINFRRLSSRHIWGVVWWLLAAVTTFCYFHFLNGVPDFYPEQQNDPFEYLQLAKSLHRGDGFPTKHWMPGFPALLAVWMKIVGLDFTLLKLCMVGVAVLLFVSCYLYFRQVLSGDTARWLTLLVAVTPLVFSYSHKLMSEIPSLAFTMLSLAAMEMLRGKEQAPAARVTWTLVLTLSCATAVMIRGNAVVLALAIVAAGLLSRREKASRYDPVVYLGAIAVVAVFAGWMLHNRSKEYTGIHNISYFEEVQAQEIKALWRAGGFGSGVERAGPADLVQRVYRNVVWHHSYNVADCLFPGAGRLRLLKMPWLGAALALLLAGPVALGIRRGLTVTPVGTIYLLLSLALVVVYPTGGASRMLIPSIPLLILCGYLGLRRVLGTAAVRGWVATVGALGLVSCALAGEIQQRHPYSYDEFGDLVAALKWVQTQYGEEPPMLISSRPEVVLALTDLRVGEMDDAIVAVESQRRQFVLVAESRVEAFEPTANLPLQLERNVLYEKGDIRIWEVRLSGNRDP